MIYACNQAESNPLVSVLMPAYNCAEHIGEAIDSILSQTHTNFELLIVDDASTDNTLQTINLYSDPRIKTIINNKNLGYLKTVNNLFKECKGEYITFQDADDWSSDNRLAKQIELLQKKTNLKFCGTFCTKFNKNYSIDVHYPITNKDILRELNFGRTSLFCGSSIMLKRELLNLTGGFREFFNRIGSEDIDWYLRAIMFAEAENIKIPLYHYRQHSSSLTKSNQNKLSLISTDIAFILHQQRLDSGKDRVDDDVRFREKIEITLKKLERTKKSSINILLKISDQLQKNNHNPAISIIKKIYLKTLYSPLANKINSYMRKRRCLKLRILIENNH